MSKRQAKAVQAVEVDFSAAPGEPFQGVVTVHVAEVHGRLEVVGVDLRTFIADGDGEALPAGGDWRPVTPMDLRSVSLPVLRQAAASMVEAKVGWRRAAGQDAGAAGEVASASGAQDRRHFLEVARIYNDAWRQGANPTAAVREHYGLTPRTAARWVEKARRDFGYLEPTTERRANGALTAKARRALATQARKG